MKSVIKKTKHMVVEKYEPPTRKPKIKALCPEMGMRKIRALDTLLDNGDLTLKEYWAVKNKVLERIRAYAVSNTPL